MPVSRGCSAALCLAVCCCLTTPLWAQEPREVPTQVSRVALFKNGFGFFLRHGVLPDQPGPVQVSPLPAAAHGTLWLSWNPAVSLTDLAAVSSTLTDSRDALNLPELLRANVGKRVRLEFGGSPPETLEGVIKAYHRAQAPPPPSPYLSSALYTPLPREGVVEAYYRAQAPPPANPYLSSALYTPLPREGEVLLLQTSRELVAFYPTSVSRLRFLEDPILQVPSERQALALRGRLVQTTPGQQLTVSYLCKGITWAPSYVVDISAPDQALFTAKAEIINEIEDLDDVAVDLVTGFPTLQFADVITPLAKKQDLAGFLRALATGSDESRARREYSGAASQMAGGYGGGMGMPGSPAEPPSTPTYGAAQAGVTSEDLFLYPLAAVTLKKDAVGYYPLFSGQVAYQHLYLWDIPDYVTERGEYSAPQDAQPEIVWHSLRLVNGFAAPWTTAPAMIVQRGQLLGQSMLKYTPAGGEGLLRITQALGVKAEENELETAREVDAVHMHDSTYDRVTVTGTLKLHNYKAEAITVRLTKLLTGQVQSTSLEAQTEKLARGLVRNNPRSKLTWEIALDPDQEREITYVYQIII